jgi:glycosyltransferase involved in cell wall biosynthesis
LNGIDHTVFRRDPNRRPSERERLGLRSGEFAVGAVGRLEPQKRFDILIEAFATLRPRYPELRLLIAGEGSSRASLEAEIDKLGLGKVCRLLGHRCDIAGFYHGIDLLAQSSDYEGTPNVVLEAMALEVPVVATDAGGTAELAEHGIHGLIVPRRDPGALAEAIERALANATERDQRVSAARKRVENELSFDARQETLEATYRELMDRC